MFNPEQGETLPALISLANATTVEWDGLYSLEDSAHRLGVKRPHVFTAESTDGEVDIIDRLEPYRVAEFGRYLLSNVDKIVSISAKNYAGRDLFKLRQFAILAGEWCITNENDDSPLRAVYLPEREIDITRSRPFGSKVVYLGEYRERRKTSRTGRPKS